MATEDHRPQQQTPSPSPPPRPPRNLRRIGLAAAAAAIVIAVFGILQRRSHEAEVTQWTQQQAVPTVAVITPKQGAATERWCCPAPSRHGTRRRFMRASPAI